MCDNEGGFSDRAVKEANGHAHVHEGWLFVVKIAQDVKGHEESRNVCILRVQSLSPLAKKVW